MPVAEKKPYGYPVRPAAEKKPYSYVPAELPEEEPDSADQPGVSKRPPDAAALNSRVLVLLASCMLTKVLEASNFRYSPLRRNHQVKSALTHLPALLSRMQALHKDVAHELSTAMRIGPKRYFKQAIRELAGLFAEE